MLLLPLVTTKESVLQVTQENSLGINAKKEIVDNILKVKNFLNSWQVLPCLRCLLEPLFHRWLDHSIKFFFVEGNGMLLKCQMSQFSIFGHKVIKKTLTKM